MSWEGTLLPEGLSHSSRLTHLRGWVGAGGMSPLDPRLSSGGYRAIPESRRPPCCFTGKIASNPVVHQRVSFCRNRTFCTVSRPAHTAVSIGRASWRCGSSPASLEDALVLTSQGAPIGRGQVAGPKHSWPTVHDASSASINAFQRGTTWKRMLLVARRLIASGTNGVIMASM
jgi:hypothetical protein